MEDFAPQASANFYSRQTKQKGKKSIGFTSGAIAKSPLHVCFILIIVLIMSLVKQGWALPTTALR